MSKAEIALSKTHTRARSNGTVEQVTVHEGARAASVPLSPMMVMIPDRTKAEQGHLVAGFSQVQHTEIREGMAAEVACESNFSITMVDTVMPARVTRVQDAICTDQVAPGGRLMDPAERIKRGQIVAHIDLIHDVHKDLLVPGGACLVQLYTTDLEGEMSGTFTAHIVSALGILKAVGLRIRAWLGLASGIGLASTGH